MILPNDATQPTIYKQTPMPYNLENKIIGANFAERFELKQSPYQQ